MKKGKNNWKEKEAVCYTYGGKDMGNWWLCKYRVVGNSGMLLCGQRFVNGRWMLDVGCWMLDVGCWMLDVGCWMLDVGCWMLDVGCWMLDVGNYNWAIKIRAFSKKLA